MKASGFALTTVLAISCVSYSAFAEELFNVAQTSLGATAVTTGAPTNRAWPGINAIPEETPGAVRGGTLFGAPMEGGVVTVTLLADCAIERVDLMQLDFRGTMCAKKVEIAVDGKVLKTLELAEDPGKYQEVPVRATGRTVSVKCLSTYPRRKLANGAEGPNYGGWARIRVMSTTDVEKMIAVPEGYEVKAMPAAVMPTGTGAKGPSEVHGRPRMAKGHPCTTWDKEDVKRFREMLKSSPVLRDQAEALRRGIDRRIQQPVSVPQPQKGPDGKWMHLPDTKYGKIHNALSLDIANLGTCYQLFGDEKYAEYARKLLLAYAEAWPNYGIGARPGFSHDPSKVFDQRLGDATWLIQVAIGYDFVRESPCFTAADHAKIAKDLVAGSGYHIRLNKHTMNGATNWSAISVAAVLAAGYACEDEELVNTAMYGVNWIDRRGKEPSKWWEGAPNARPSGIELHFSEKCIDVDGMWCEGAMGYQFMALQALVVDAEMLWRHGIDMYRYRGCAMKCIFDSPLYFCYPNLVAPGIHDAFPTTITGYNADLYEYGYLRYRDPKYLEILRRINRRLAAGFQLFTISTLYDVDLAQEGEVVAPESVNLDGVGYGIIRVTDGEGTRNLLLDYGPNRSHGHPDKLSLDFWAFGEQQAPDPGCVWYEQPIYRNWYRTTFAHNTLSVDMQEQAACDGELLVYAAGDSLGIMRGRADKAYPGVVMDRGVFLTRGYLADLFAAVGTMPRTYDLAWHQLGACEGVTGEAKPFSLPEPRSPGYSELKDLKAVSGAESVVASYLNKGRRIRLVAVGGEETTFVWGAAQIGTDRQIPVFERRKAATTVFGNVLDLSGAEAVRKVTQSGGLDRGFAALEIALADGGRDFCYLALKDGARTVGKTAIDAQQAFVSVAKDGALRALAFGGGTRVAVAGFELASSVPGSAIVERTEAGGWLVSNCGRNEATISAALPERTSFVLKGGETREIPGPGGRTLAACRQETLKRLAAEAAAKAAKEKAAREAQAAARRADAAKLPAPAGFKTVIQAEDYAAEGGGRIQLTDTKTGAVGKAFFHWDDEGHWIEWKASVPQEGYYQILLCGCTNQDRRNRVAINGEEIVELGDFTFPATGGYANGSDDWRLVAIKDPMGDGPMTFKLRAGENTIRLTHAGGSGLNMDYLVVADPNTKVERIH